MIISNPLGATKLVRCKSRAADDTEKSLSEKAVNINENRAESKRLERFQSTSFKHLDLAIPEVQLYLCVLKFNGTTACH